MDDISSLDNYEYVCLVANYNSMTGGKKIDDTLESRGYTPEAIAQARGKFAATFSPVKSCNLRFTKPFEHLKFEPMSYVLTLFDNYERGCLPFPGSVSEQPAQIMEIFSVLRQLRHESELKLRETSKATPRRK